MWFRHPERQHGRAACGNHITRMSYGLCHVHVYVCVPVVGCRELIFVHKHQDRLTNGMVFYNNFLKNNIYLVFKTNFRFCDAAQQTENLLES